MSERIFDFVIIGSGLGGLQCAYILADHGYSVCVLEKNQQLGGCLQVFSREQALFDTGVHYIAGLSEGQNLYTYFKYFGLMDTIKWRKLDEDGFDHISFDGDEKSYRYAQGWGAFEKSLIADFPEEENAISEYGKTIRKVVASFPLDNVDYSASDHTDDAILEVNAKQFIDGLTENTKLRAVLGGSNLLYAGTAEKCPLYVHALVTHGYVLSAYRCVDGGSQIAKSLARSIREKGGEIHRRKAVASFIKEGKDIAAVVTEDGEEFRAKKFISNIQPKILMQLIGKENVQTSYYNRMQKLENTLSSFCVHIVCKPRSFPYLNHNIYHHTTENVWTKPDYIESEWPLNFMLSTPATTRSPKYAEGISIVSYMRFNEVKDWVDTHRTIVNPGDRNEHYEKFKKEKIEKLLKAVEKRFPNIREHIQNIHATTPLTFRDYIGNDDGNMYGTEKDFRKTMTNFIPSKTKIPNLWHTGQYLNLHGMLGVTISSVVTCSRFVGRKQLLEKIKSA